MAANNQKASGQVFLDTSSAQFALEKLNRQIDKYDAKLKSNTLTAREMQQAEKERLGLVEKRGKVQEQIEKGIGATLDQQRKYVSALNKELIHVAHNTEEWTKKYDAFKTAKLRLNEMEDSINSIGKAQKTWLQEAKTIGFGVFIGNTVQSAIQAASGYLSGMVSGNAKLSDSLSDIEKSTGLSAAAVAQLNSELSKIDTRTATADLREIAVGLGQIGEAANKENVQAIDQIVVALGDEFGGGAKQITTTLSVLRNNLSDIKTGNYAQDVTHIGNALNELGANGLATAPVVTDITNRIAGIGRTFGLTSGQILGTAATFQELGIETERGSTAITKMFQKIGAEPEKFAKVAGIGVKEFKNLINTDMLSAFEAVAVGAKKAGGNNVVFSQILKELDADGSGVGEVLSKLAVNTDMLSGKVNLATEALKSNSSISEEFGKKNNNLAANLEKLGKAFNSLITSKTLSDFFNAGVVWLLAFINGLKAVPQWLKQNQTGIYLVLAGIVLLNAEYIKLGALIVKDTAVKLYNAAATKAVAIGNDIAAKSKVALGIVTNLLTGKITIATAATQLFGGALKTALGPIGWIAIAIGALVVAIASLPKAYNAAQVAAQNLLEVQQNAAKAVQDERIELDALLAVAKDETKSKQERQKAIDSINALMPEYIEKLTLETINTDAGKKSIDSYIESLSKKALAQAYMSKLQDMYNKQLEFENTSLEDNVKWYEIIGNYIKAGGNITGAQMYDLKTGLINKNERRKELDNEINSLKKQFNDDVKSGKATLEMPLSPKASTKIDNSSISPFAKSDKTSTKKETDPLLKELADFQAELEKIGKQSDETEIGRITKKYNELIAKASHYTTQVIQLESAKNKAVKVLFDQHMAKVAKEEQEQHLQTISNGTYEIEFKIQLLQDFAADQTNHKELQKQALKEVAQLQKELNKQRLEDEKATNQKATEEHNKILRQSAASHKAKLEYQKITASNPDDALKAEIALMNHQKQLELQNADLTESEIKLIKEKYRQQENDLIIKHYANQVTNVLNNFQAALSILDQFTQATNAKENAAFEKEKQKNNSKKKEIENLAKSKVISQIEAQRRLREIDIEEEKRKEELEKKQHARNKRMAIAQAVVNGALAITKILAETPKFDFGVATAIQIGLAIATTAAQIATISAQKFALGGKVLPNGKITQAQNIPTQSNGDNILATVRTGEVILNERQQAALGGASTFAAIGVPGFASGGYLKPFYKTRPYQALNYIAIAQRQMAIQQFAAGGLVGKKPVVSVNAPQQEDTEMKNIMRAVLYQLQNPVVPSLNINNEISLRKIKDAEKLQANIIADSKGL